MRWNGLRDPHRVCEGMGDAEERRGPAVIIDAHRERLPDRGGPTLPIALLPRRNAEGQKRIRPVVAVAPGLGDLEVFLDVCDAPPLIFNCDAHAETPRGLELARASSRVEYRLGQRFQMMPNELVHEFSSSDPAEGCLSADYAAALFLQTDDSFKAVGDELKSTCV